MAKGRHAGEASGGFYRDLAIMTLGVLLVGAAVFTLLYLLVGDGSPEATTTSTTATTTSSSLSSSTTGDTSTTSSSSTTEPTTSTVPLRPPSEVHVLVLNSVGIPGAAGDFTTELAEAGYQTLQPADYEPLQDPSRIWYREGFSAEANELLEFIPDALVEPLPDDDLGPGADVIVVLGAGYEG